MGTAGTVVSNSYPLEIAKFSPNVSVSNKVVLCGFPWWKTILLWRKEDNIISKNIWMN